MELTPSGATTGPTEVNLTKPGAWHLLLPASSGKSLDPSPLQFYTALGKNPNGPHCSSYKLERVLTILPDCPGHKIGEATDLD